MVIGACVFVVATNEYTIILVYDAIEVEITFITFVIIAVDNVHATCQLIVVIIVANIVVIDSVVIMFVNDIGHI